MAYSPIFSQGEVQWSSSVDAGDEAGSSTGYADWIFDIIATQNGNLFAVGFAREDESGSSAHPDVPGYFLMNANGRVLKDVAVETNGHGPQGRFKDAMENSVAYYAAGSRAVNGASGALLVKVNKQTLEPDLVYDFIPAGYVAAKFVFVESLNNEYLLATGLAKDAAGIEHNLFVVFDVMGNYLCHYVTDNISVTSNSATIQATATESDGAGGFSIYYISKEIVNNVASSGHRRIDSDIRLGKLSFSPPCSFTTTTSQAYNSITQGSTLGQNAAPPVPGNIFYDHPPTNKLDKYAYGPMYRGIPGLERNFPNCSESAPIPGLSYIEDWSDGSEDNPVDMVISNGKIVITAGLNMTIMFTGTNTLLGKDAADGLNCSGNGCGSYDSRAYLWGEAYLMMFDKNNLHLDKATHLGTWSGGDFSIRLIKTTDGGFAVSGTVTGCTAENDGPIQGEQMMMVKLNANGDIEYRQHADGPGTGSCGFAIAQTADGGFVMAGNSEHDGPNNEENYCVIKVSAGNCRYQAADILPNNNLDYVIQSTEELWDADKTVNAHVVVPNGKKLRIVGKPDHQITIRFADSREAHSYKNRGMIGIEVQPGGQLVVNNAILTGWDCDGTEKMWDGISVIGQPALPQTTANQGDFLISYSTIKNARMGTVLGGLWVQNTPQTTTVPGTNSVNIAYSSSLESGGSFGGGKIFGINTNYEDCRRSVHFTKYAHNMSGSKFWNCRFASNGPLVDPNEMAQPAQSGWDDFVQRGTVSHVSAWSTRVQFSNCNFTGSTAIEGFARPLGIEGDDSKFIVLGGTMTDLRVGIDCRGITGGLLASSNVSGVTFNQCNQAINLRASVGDKITGNHFYIPVPNGVTADLPTGIFGVNTVNTLVENNDMHGDAPNKPGYGIVMRNTYNQGATIKGNDFFNILTGNQFEGQNQKLSASCNDYTNMGSEAWSCLPMSGALKEQGEVGSQGAKADNQFFDACPTSSTQNKHIYSEFAFLYYDKTGNAFRAMDDCVSDVVGLNTAFDGTLIACSPTVPPCDPPCDRLLWFAGTDKTLDQRNVAVRDLIHTGQDGDGNDLPARYDDAMTALRLRGLDEDRRIVTGTLLGQDRYTEAQMELALIGTGTNAENDAIRTYLNNLTIAGSDAHSLTNTQYTNTLAALNSKETTDAVLATNLQGLREGLWTPLVQMRKEGGKSEERTEDVIKQHIPFTNQVTVSPNPFDQRVIFNLSSLPELTYYEVIISNISGKQVANLNYEGGQILVWNATSIQPGVYFYSVRSSNGQIAAQGRLVKI